MASYTEDLDRIFTAYDVLLTRDPVDPNDITAPDEVEEEPLAPPRVPLNLEPIARPNGEEYLPRKISIDDEKTAVARTDVDFVRVAYDNRMPVLLYGPPGTGKTALLEAALPGLVTVVGTAETEVSDFEGSWVQRTDGTYTWIDGPLVKAMESGTPLLIDEIALVDPRTMSVVYSVMDGRDELAVTANPARETVRAADGFMVLGACNPNVPGAVMSDALLSRFQIHVEVRTDWDLAKRLGCGLKIITVAKNLAAKEDSGEVVSAPQLREILVFQKCVETFGQTVALRNLVAQARVEDRDTYTAMIASVFGTSAGTLTF